jgi:hypothetical protein
MYIYRYRYVLTNSAGDQQTAQSPVYDNPYKMSIALLQSYRFLEQRLLGDLALIRRHTPDSLLDLIKLKMAISRARVIITQICEEPIFPGEITEGFSLLEFTPEYGSVPLRAATMELVVKYCPDYERTMLVRSANSSPQPRQTHFTPVEYKFINRYLRTMPKFPSV